MKPYTPKYERKRMPFQLQQRDIEVLKLVNVHRFIKSGQIKRLAFPETSMAVCHRRLKLKYHNFMIGRIPGAVIEPGHGNCDIAYHLESGGRNILLDNGIKNPQVPKHKPNALTNHLQHTLAVAEHRVQWEIGLRQQDRVQMDEYVHEFQLRKHISKGSKGRQLYRLHWEFDNPRKLYICHPDSAVIISSKSNPESRAIFYSEVDLGSENIKTTICDKVFSYSLLKKSKLTEKMFGIQNITVLFETTTEQRAADVRKAIDGRVAGANLFWITTAKKLAHSPALTARIWTNSKGELKSILK